MERTWGFERFVLHLKLVVTYRDFRAGEFICSEGKEADFLYIIQSGRIRIERYTAEGRAVTIRVIRTGEIFGESVILDKIRADNAVREINSRVAACPRREVIATLRNQPQLAELITQHLVKTNKSMSNSLELREIRSARNRAIRYLEMVRSPGKHTIQFDRPYKDIALEIGLTPEAFYRTLAELERDNIISRKDRTITFCEEEG